MRDSTKDFELAWDDFLHQRWIKVAQKTGVTQKNVEEAVVFLRDHCYPYPLSLLNGLDELEGVILNQILILHLVDGIFSLEVPGEDEFSLQLDFSFLSGQGRFPDLKLILSRDEERWMQIHLERAQLIIDALHQRWGTLRQVGEYLVDRQSLYLRNTSAELIPLTRRMVAKDLGLSELTVCRAVKNKILQLPNGRFMLLSELFDRHLSVKNRIADILARLRKPLSDFEISQRLRVIGYPIARRTVAKYRGQLHLPNCYLQS